MILQRWAESARIGTIGHPTPAALWLLRWIARPWMRLMHRPTIDGIENLPASGAYLLVANHSGAMAVAELLCFAVVYVERVGVERPIAGFAFPTAFHVWPVSWMLRNLGAVPSSYGAGERALGSGVPILIFPGGDIDATRPIWKHATVDFDGRVGFLKLARRAGVPIVPMAFLGSHFTAPIVWQAKGLLRWLCVVPVLVRIKYWPITLLGVVGALAIVRAMPTLWGGLLAWIWLVTPVSFLPWVPWTVRARIGPPIDALPDDLAEASEVVAAKVEALLRQRGVTTQPVLPPE